MPPSKSPRKEADEGEEREAKAQKTEDEPRTEAKGPTTGQKAAAAGQGAVPRDETPRKPLVDGGVRLVHWNVSGLAALLKDEAKRARLTRLIDEERPDVLAISEHKISEQKHAAAKADLAAAVPGFSAHWAICTAKNGYSGVVCLVRDGVEIVGEPQIDSVCSSLHEGRTVTLELSDCFAIAAYVPNSGQKLERLDYRIGTWEPAMRSHLETLGKKKPVVLFGDLNVGHLDADIWNVKAKHIPKSAGLTPKERAAFGQMLEEGPYVDCFRQLWPEANGCFSFWSTRSGNEVLNRGLRLDYAVASASVMDGSGPLSLHDCAILYDYAPRGDHAPTLVSLSKTK